MSDSFPYMLYFDQCSTACVRAIFHYELGEFIVRDAYASRVIVDGTDGVYNSTPGPALDCLSSEARAAELRHHGKARLYTPNQHPPFRPPDGLRVNCTDFAAAHRINTVIARALLPADAELDENAENVWLWVYGDNSDSPEPDCPSYIYLHGGCDQQPTWTLDGNGPVPLPRLPDLLAQRQPRTDLDFWGRIRVMALMAMDAAGLFEAGERAEAE